MEKWLGHGGESCNLSLLLHGGAETRRDREGEPRQLLIKVVVGSRARRLNSPSCCEIRGTKEG